MQNIKGVLLDLSGVLHDGEHAIDGSIAALEKLRATGMPCRFVSNTTRLTSAALLERLRELGFSIDRAELFTAPIACKHWLLEHSLRPLLLVHPSLRAEFAELEQHDPNGVLLADAGEAFEYHALNEAFRLLKTGAPLIATGRNRYYRDGEHLSLDIGPFVAALEFAADVNATVLGKPSAEFFLAAIHDLGLEPEMVLMIGDDVENDVNAALQIGCKAMLVETGKFENADAQKTRAPVVANLAAAVDRILGE